MSNYSGAFYPISLINEIRGVNPFVQTVVIYGTLYLLFSYLNQPSINNYDQSIAVLSKGKHSIKASIVDTIYKLSDLALIVIMLIRLGTVWNFANEALTIFSFLMRNIVSSFIISVDNNFDFIKDYVYTSLFRLSPLSILVAYLIHLQTDWLRIRLGNYYQNLSVICLQNLISLVSMFTGSKILSTNYYSPTKKYIWFAEAYDKTNDGLYSNLTLSHLIINLLILIPNAYLQYYSNTDISRDDILNLHYYLYGDSRYRSFYMFAVYIRCLNDILHNENYLTKSLTVINNLINSYWLITVMYSIRKINLIRILFNVVSNWIPTLSSWFRAIESMEMLGIDINMFNPTGIIETMNFYILRYLFMAFGTYSSISFGSQLSIVQSLRNSFHNNAFALPGILNAKILPALTKVIRFSPIVSRIDFAFRLAEFGWLFILIVRLIVRVYVKSISSIEEQKVHSV